MLQRTKKQIGYGISFIIGLLLIITGLNYLAGKLSSTPQITPTPIPKYSQISIETVEAIRHQIRPGIENTIDIVARLRNPNPTAGVKSLQLTFIVKSPTGAEIKRVPVETYIMPGAIQYAMALNVPVGQQQVGVIEAELLPISFIALPPDTNPPTFSAFARGRQEKTIGDLVTEDQIGIVKNTSTFAWGKVEVYVVGLNSQSKVVAAGKTFVGALTVGEEREFSVSWPAPTEAIERVLILPATNMFEEQNIIRAIGNPGLLQ